MSMLSRLFGRRRATGAAVPAIDADSLARRLQTEPPLLLDVRNTEEFTGPLGHLAGAVNLPLPELASRIARIAPDRQQEIVVLCLSDRRSTQAILQLRAIGYSRLLLLSGGMQAWTARALPVVVGR